MTCEEVERNDTLAAYIAGKLPEAERDQFEEHYFGCDRCLQEVEAARLAREILLANPVQRAKAVRRWWIPLAAAAAIVIVGFASWLGMTPQPEHREQIKAETAKASTSEMLLARFDPPAYRPSTLRGAEKTARGFRDAMKLYLSGDYAGAAAGLRGVDSVEARYYLGISELLIGNRTDGLTELLKVIDAGDTPFRSEARFYAAKALIGAGALPEARAELDAIIQDRSDLAPQARELLSELPKP